MTRKIIFCGTDADLRVVKRPFQRNDTHPARDRTTRFPRKHFSIATMRRPGNLDANAPGQEFQRGIAA